VLVPVTYRIAAINAEGTGPYSNVPANVVTSGGGGGSSGLKNVPAVMPLRPGFFEGGSVYYIATESSDATTAGIITASQGWTTNLSTVLTSAPAVAVSPVYVFTNGIVGDGIHGFQPEVFPNIPSNIYDPVTEMYFFDNNSEYTPLRSHVEVTWNGGHTPTILDSVADILQAETDGKVTLATVGIVSNFPHVVWPGGAMIIREDTTLTDETPFRPDLPSGQIIDIDTAAMTVTFVAHKVWGPSGDYNYIVCTDFSLPAPAKQMGVPYVPLNRNIFDTLATASMAQFTNGGGQSGDKSGPFKQQAGIGDVDVGDADYTPFQDVPKVYWPTAQQAHLVTSYPEMETLVASGDLIYNTLVEPDAILNCPLVDPS